MILVNVIITTRFWHCRILVVVQCISLPGCNVLLLVSSCCSWSWSREMLMYAWVRLCVCVLRHCLSLNIWSWSLPVRSAIESSRVTGEFTHCKLRLLWNRTMVQGDAPLRQQKSKATRCDAMCDSMPLRVQCYLRVKTDASTRNVIVCILRRRLPSYKTQ